MPRFVENTHAAGLETACGLQGRRQKVSGILQEAPRMDKSILKQGYFLDLKLLPD